MQFLCVRSLGLVRQLSLCAHEPCMGIHWYTFHDKWIIVHANVLIYSHSLLYFSIIELYLSLSLY